MDMILSVLMFEFIFYTSLNIIFVPSEVIKTYFDMLVKTVIGFLVGCEKGENSTC